MLSGLVNGRIETGKISISLHEIFIPEFKISTRSGDQVFYAKSILISYSLKDFILNGAASSVKNLEIREPAASIKYDSSGAWNAAELVTKKPVIGAHQKPAKPFRGNIKIESGSFTVNDDRFAFKSSVNNIQGNLTTDSNGVMRFHFSAEEGQKFRESPINLDGSVYAYGFRANFEGKNINLAGLGNYLLKNPGFILKAGRGDLNLSFYGNADLPLFQTLNSLDFTGSLDVGNAAFKIKEFPENFNHIYGRLNIANSLVYTERLKGQYHGWPLTTRGRIFNFLDPYLSIKVKIPSVDAALVKPLLPKGLGISGICSGIVNIEGPALNLQISGQVQSHAFSIAGKSFFEGRLDFFVAENAIQVKSFSAAIERGFISAKGWIMLKDKPWVILSLNSRLASVEEMNIFKNAKGSLDLDITAMGYLNNPYLFGKASISHGAFLNQNFSRAQASFIAGGGIVWLGNSFVEKEGKISAGAGFIDLKKDSFLIPVRFDRYKFISPYSAGGSNPELALNGSALIQGKISKPLLAGHIDSGRLFSGKTSAALSSFNFYLGEKDFAAGPLRIDIGRGHLTLLGDGRLDKTGELAMAGYSPSMDFKDMKELLPVLDYFPAKGKGEIVFNLKKNPAGLLHFNFYSGIGAGTLMFSGGVNLKNSRYLTFFDAEDIAAGNISTPFLSDAHLKGKFTGTGLIFGKGKNGNIDASFSAEKASAYGFPVSKIFANIAFSPTGLTFNDIAVSGLSGSIYANGTVSSGGRIKVSIEGKNLNLDQLVNNLKYANFNARNFIKGTGFENIKGSAFIKSVISGSMNDPKLDGEISVWEGILNNRLFSANGKISLDKRELSFKPFNFYQGLGALSVNGAVFFGTRAILNLSASTKKIDINFLTAFTFLNGIQAQGTLDGDLMVQGTSESPLINGKVAVSNLLVGRQYFNLVEAVFRSQKKNLFLDSMKIRIRDAALTGDGEIFSNGTMKFNFRSLDFPLNDLDFPGPYLGRIEGKGDLLIKISGSRRNPRAALNFLAEDVLMRNEHFDVVQGNLLYSGRTLSFQPFILVEGDSSYRLDGSVKFPVNYPPEFALMAKVSGGNINKIFSVLDHPFKKTIYGTVNGELTLEGNMRKPRFNLDARMTDALISGIPLSLIDAKMEFNENAVNVQEFLLQGRDSSARIQGKLEMKGDNKLKIRAENFNMAVLHSFIPQLLFLGGNLSMEMDSSGETSKPNFDSKLLITDGRLGIIPFDSLTGRLSASAGTVNLQDFQLKRGKHLASISGVMPLHLKDNKVESPAPMDIKTSISEDDLSIFNLFGPVVKESSGSLKAQIRLTGLIGDINTEGSVQIKKGYVQLEALRNPINDINLNAIVSGKVINIEDLSGRADTGSFKISGTAGISNFNLSDFNLRFTSNDALISASKYFDGRLTSGVRIEGTMQSPSIIGDIRIRDSNITIPKLPDLTAETAGTHYFKSVAFLDLNLHADKDVWIKILNSSVNIAGDMKVLGNWPHPGLKGEIELSKGTFRFLSGTFKLNKGIAYFDGSSSFMPAVEIEGETLVSGTHVYVDLTGGLDNPKYTLSSDPPHAPSEIVYLLGPQVLPIPVTPPSGTYTGTSVTSVDWGRPISNILASYLVEPFTAAVGKAFALDDITFEYTLPGYYAFTLAKALDVFQKFLVTYTRVYTGQGEVRRLYGIEYRFQRRMLLKISMDERGNYYFSIQARYNF
ncbi:MAG: translocation/assembly module TamB domain-containing protein [Firmicutes bacterium]|nr:translocation/assembly module TamB domain-containing protein [Bacillota bacterium]